MTTRVLLCAPLAVLPVIWWALRRGKPSRERDVRRLVDHTHQETQDGDTAFTAAVMKFGALARAKLGGVLSDTPANRLVANKVVGDLMEEQSVRACDRVRIAPFVAAGLFIPTLWEVEAAAIRCSAYAQDRMAALGNPHGKHKFRHKLRSEALTWGQVGGVAGAPPPTPPGPASVPPNTPPPKGANREGTGAGTLLDQVQVGRPVGDPTQIGLPVGSMTTIRFGTFDE